MNNSRRVLRGFLAMSISSFLVMGLQLGYAAITARLLAPGSFGAYAVALSGVGLIGMLGGSSFGQAAARRGNESTRLDRSLLGWALLMGSVVAVAAVMLAPAWGRLWGIPESTSITRVMAAGLPFTALAAVAAGILRRSGRTPTVAGLTAIAQVMGMTIGLVAVVSMRTTWSLGVAPVAALALTTAFLSASLPRDCRLPCRPNTDSLEDVLYGLKSAGLNLLRYGANILPAWSIGRFAGISELGMYNRASTLLTVPLDAVQRSFTYTLFPELRPNGPVSRKQSTFTDLLIIVTWPVVILAGAGVFMVTPLLSYVLGPNWDMPPAIPVIAFLLGVVPIIGVPLGSALEAQGHFRQTALAWCVAAVCVLIGITGTAITRSPTPALLGLLASSISNTSVYFMACVRQGMVRPHDYLRGIWTVVVAQGLATAITTCVALYWGPITATASWAVGITMLVLWGVTALLFGRRTRFGSLAKQYGFPGFGDG